MKYNEYIVLFFSDVIVLNFQPPHAPMVVFYKELLHEKKIINIDCFTIRPVYG